MDTKKRYSIPIARPTLVGDEAVLIQSALSSGWVSMGPLTQDFEHQVCAYTGAQHAVAVNSCTSAIHLAMLVNGIGSGHDVICPSYSFIATANGIRHAGAEPCFVDIDPNTLNLDPVATEALIVEQYTETLHHKKSGRRLRGILLVHQIGIPGDLDAFEAIARKYDLVLIEDNACGLGSSYKNRPLGSSGHCSTLSFHPRKVITTGEGGMLLTGSKELADQARVLRAHGMSISDLARHHAASTTYEAYEVVGYNYRLTDMQSALGIKQMEHLDTFIARRKAVAAAYNAAFSDIEALSVITPPSYVSSWNYQSYPVSLNGASVKERDLFMTRLNGAGIATRRGIPPIHQEPVYQSGLQLLQTEKVSSRSVFLPIFPLMSDEEVEYVIGHVRDTAEKIL